MSRSRGVGVQAPQRRAHALLSGPITGGSGLPPQTPHSLLAAIERVDHPAHSGVDLIRRRLREVRPQDRLDRPQLHGEAALERWQFFEDSRASAGTRRLGCVRGGHPWPPGRQKPGEYSWLGAPSGSLPEPPPPASTRSGPHGWEDASGDRILARGHGPWSSSHRARDSTWHRPQRISQPARAPQPTVGERP